MHLQAALEHLESIIYNPWEKKGEEEVLQEGEEGEPKSVTEDGSPDARSAANGTV